MSAKLTVRQFFEVYPDDDACLEHVMQVRFGLRHTCRKCGVVDATFHRLAKRKAYACASCGDNLYPCAGTIFQDSRTSLQSWFYAIYLFCVTRHGVSGKELERALGVTYKTAWRMGQQIRTLMKRAESFEIMQGHVELDEMYVGGRRQGPSGRGAIGKTVVIGAAERGGRTVAKVAPNAKSDGIRKLVQENVSQDAIITTDEWASYRLLKTEGWKKHDRVMHGRRHYVKRDEKTGVLHHTNTIESFWGLFKKSVASTHIHVSSKYMQRYLDEFTFRANHREMRNAMFDLLIGAV